MSTTLLAPTVDTHEYDHKLEEIWEKIDKISLDYAVMGRRANDSSHPCRIWLNDVGSWASMYDVLKLDSRKWCKRQ